MPRHRRQPTHCGPSMAAVPRAAPKRGPIRAGTVEGARATCRLPGAGAAASADVCRHWNRVGENVLRSDRPDPACRGLSAPTAGGQQGARRQPLRSRVPLDIGCRRSWQPMGSEKSVAAGERAGAAPYLAFRKLDSSAGRRWGSACRPLDAASPPTVPPPLGRPAGLPRSRGLPGDAYLPASFAGAPAVAVSPNLILSTPR